MESLSNFEKDCKALLQIWSFVRRHLFALSLFGIACVVTEVRAGVDLLLLSNHKHAVLNKLRGGFGFEGWIWSNISLLCFLAFAAFVVSRLIKNLAVRDLELFHDFACVSLYCGGLWWWCYLAVAMIADDDLLPAGLNFHEYGEFWVLASGVMLMHGLILAVALFATLIGSVYSVLSLRQFLSNQVEEVNSFWEVVEVHIQKTPHFFPPRRYRKAFKFICAICLTISILALVCLFVHPEPHLREAFFPLFERSMAVIRPLFNLWLIKSALVAVIAVLLGRLVEEVRELAGQIWWLCWNVGVVVLIASTTWFALNSTGPNGLNVIAHAEYSVLSALLILFHALIICVRVVSVAIAVCFGALTVFVKGLDMMLLRNFPEQVFQETAAQ